MAEEKKRGAFSNMLSFIRASRAEMKNVVWPTKRQVVKNTAVVFGFVLLCGAFIWTADVALQYLVNGLFNIIH